MDEALRRILAFEKAGADVLYVPLVPDIAALKRLLGYASSPVNALAAGAVAGLTVEQIAAIGVRRISVGSMIARLSHAAIRDAMHAMMNRGSFDLFAGAAKGSEIDELLLKGENGRIDTKIC